MSAQDDAADVARVLGGDVSAFEPIVRRWQGPLINLAYRFCRDRGRAEDMAQEAFLRAYRGLRTPRFRRGSSHWPATSIAPKSGGCRRQRCRSRRGAPCWTGRTPPRRSTMNGAIAPSGGPCCGCRRNIATH